ncbi:MAG: acyl-CoA dehydrogenase [Acidimicrobiia bacterium]
MLSALGAGDLSAARLVEGHLDALAIAAELGTPDLVSEHHLAGVWAAQPTGVRARRGASTWTLCGQKDWCSGAGIIECALVTASAADGPRLFAVNAGHIDVLRETWEPRGMLASASATVAFDGSRSIQPLGGPNAYVDRAGFGHGGVGVAAVWFGATVTALLGCRPVADAVSERARWGGARAAVEAAGARLAQAADEIDAHPCDRARAVSLAHSVRLTVSDVARSVVRLATEISGTSGLCRDSAYHQSLIDLDVYLTQIRAGAVGVEHANAIGELRCW